MNNRRSGKPFSGKKGKPAKTSESRDSDKNSYKAKKKFTSTGSGFHKHKSDKRSEKNADPDSSFEKNKFSKGKAKSFKGAAKAKVSTREDPSPFRKKNNYPGKKEGVKGRTHKSGNFSKSTKKEDGRTSGNKARTRKTKLDFSEKPAKQPFYNIKPPKGSKKKEAPVTTDGKIRLNKYIANSGVCSRRDADELISLGEVAVNGQIVTELGFKVTKDDVVTLNGRRLKPEKLVYVLLNKPKDFITTTDDPHERKTVMALVQNACKERIFPVGRLDRNTTGLLLFTNDGDLAEKLTHPRKKVKKIYQADLDKPITREDFEKILNGLRLEDGPIRPDALEIVSPDKRSIGIEIHEGRNRIVRRIFEHLGYEVVRLDRVMYAGLTKKDLPRGHWRYLSEKEVIRLKYF